MFAYKAFCKDLTCRGYRYEIGKWQEEPEANCVKNGFHGALNPLHCFSYYPDAENSRYFIVELAGDVDEDCSDTKVAATKIRLVKELTVSEMAQAGCRYLLQHPNETVCGSYGPIRVETGPEPSIGSLQEGKFGVLCRKDGKGMTQAVALLRGGKRYRPDRCYMLGADGQIVEAEKEAAHEAL